MAQERLSISFEDFTSTTLRSVKSALDAKRAGSRIFWDPDIIIGIYLRAPRDIADLEGINKVERGR